MNVRARIRDQYDQFPYPHRAAEDEDRRLQVRHAEVPGRLVHYGFAGRQDFSGFRALIAGGGTGDSTVYLAWALRHTAAEIVHLDLSRSANAITEARLARRGLTGVRVVQGAIEDLAGLGLGPFDYINCTGVLHHLADPEAGLRALKAVLSPTGAMALMVYAPYGRFGIDLVRGAVSALGESHSPPESPAAYDQRLALLQGVRSMLGPDHPLRGQSLHDATAGEEAGLVDLFLNAHERSYTMAELHDLLATAGLHFQSVVEPGERDAYDPLSYLPGIQDPALRARLGEAIEALSRVERHALAERLHGQMRRHEVYASARASTLASLSERDLKPFFLHPELGSTVKAQLPAMLRTATGGRTARITLPGGLVAGVPGGEAAARVIESIDGTTSLAALEESLAAFPEAAGDPGALLERILAPLIRRDVVLLAETPPPEP